MENSIKDIINNSLEQIRNVVDADTIIGQPIRTESGTIIIPVSKVSVGMATGGLDLPLRGENNNKNFGGGGGTGVTVSPIGFLTVYPNGAVEMLPIAPAQASPIEQVADILDQAPGIINRIKSVFVKDEAEEDSEEILAAAAAAAAQLEEDIENEKPLSKKDAKKLAKLQKKEAAREAKEAKKATAGK